MVIYKILLFGLLLVGVVAQLLLKKGMKDAGIRSFKNGNYFLILKKIFFNWAIVLGFICYGLSVFVWLVVLSGLELSYAYPMFAAGYFFVALFSKIFFNEKVTAKRWFSILIIIVGVVIVGFS